MRSRLLRVGESHKNGYDRILMPGKYHAMQRSRPCPYLAYWLSKHARNIRRCPKDASIDPPRIWNLVGGVLSYEGYARLSCV